MILSNNFSNIVELLELFGGIFSRHLQKHLLSSWMFADELGDVVNLAIKMVLKM